MRSDSIRFLVDTNIAVYAYDPADRVKQERAVMVLQTLEANSTGALTAQVLGEFLTTAIRKIQPPLTVADAEREIVNLVRSWLVFDVTTAAVLEAIRLMQRLQLAYWDGLIMATAKLNGVPNILSRDGNDGAVLEGVRYLNPFSPSFDLATLTAS